MADVRQERPREDLAGPAYVELLKERLDAEVDRSASLERRATATVTASSFLGSLLIGLAGISGIGDRSGGRELVWMFAASVVLLLAAAGSSLLANRIQKQQEIPPREFHRLIHQYWNGPIETGERRASQVRVSLYEQLYKRNGAVAKVLEWGLYLQVAAVAAVGVTALAVLLNRA